MAGRTLVHTHSLTSHTHSFAAHPCMQLCLANCRDLARLIQWNKEHDIRFMCTSSVLFPWMVTFRFKDLPQARGAALQLAWGDCQLAGGWRKAL